MKLVSLLCVLIFSISSSFADDRVLSLEEFCSDDPTGEIYSEVIDAYDTVTQFDIVDLDSNDYSNLEDGYGVKAWDGLSIFDIAELERSRFPEISRKLEIWEEDTCESRGAEMYKEYLEEQITTK